MIEKAVQTYDKVTDLFKGITQPPNKFDIVAADMEYGAMEN